MRRSRSLDGDPMSERDRIGHEQFQDLVVLFDSTGAMPSGQCTLAVFEGLCAGDGALPAHAGGQVRAAYVVVGSGLMIRGLVFFTFSLDAEGRMCGSFNIPLQYLVRAAGVRADLGIGPARVASRSQCPVPWLALNLWEPSSTGEASVSRQIQRVIWRSRDQLRPVARTDVYTSPASTDDALLTETQTEQSVGVPEVAATGACEAALIETASLRSRIVPRQVREDLFRQQQGYLKQMRKFREEIYKLKLALRQEQERNRRLQELLRGEI